jgi:hypothetical protein
MSALAGLRSHCQGSGAAADQPVPLVKEQELPLHTLQSQMTRRHMMTGAHAAHELRAEQRPKVQHLVHYEMGVGSAAVEATAGQKAVVQALRSWRQPWFRQLWPLTRTNDWLT